MNGLGIILAGGRSHRFGGANSVPKPLIPLAGCPLVLWAAAKLAAAGASDIIVLTGANHAAMCTGLGLTGRQARLETGCGLTATVELRYSGEDDGTAGRLLALRHDELQGGALLSYTDVLTDAPLAELARHRQETGAALSLLTVTPDLPWGVVTQRDGRVTDFAEKPKATGWEVSAGFMSLDQRVLECIEGPEEMLEDAPMRRLIARGAVTSLHWPGLWRPVDTPKDLVTAEGHAGALFDPSNPPRLRPRT